MEMTQQDCERVLSTLSVGEQSRLLSLLGHELTVLGRTAYEFQGPGDTDPRLLRDINEMQHRIYSQLFSLARNGQPSVATDALASWLFAEHKPHLQPGFSWAFARAFERFRTAV